ncbi:MAG: RdgB/HAM1 family non-canonical purine NTP pyrophosphatase [Dehalococcoidia bacterium]|nr:RdgB/HAM1 family non-canonical purine NTP pyrophosphatase [Dehalococcoidia bacterium]MYA54174.1 RdgB/HAM1 family non-canonical purine NTP pyrophosphatase [Dehalococcoidia bacterium]
MTRLLLATNNPGKVREMRRLLAGEPFEVVTPADLGIELDVVEDGDGYAENATLKARAFAEAGGCLALADDSGIEVDALDGRPGPLSARFGGPGLDDAGRTQLMLRELRDVPDGERGARYRAVAAVAGPGEHVERFEGTWEGSIGREPRGENGFGYDPIFRTGDGRSGAELSAAEKDAVSHRGQAVRAAAAWLRESQR